MSRFLYIIPSLSKVTLLGSSYVAYSASEFSFDVSRFQVRHYNMLEVCQMTWVLAQFNDRIL